MIDIEGTRITRHIAVIRRAPPATDHVATGNAAGDPLLDQHFLSRVATVIVEVGPMVEQIAVIST